MAASAQAVSVRALYRRILRLHKRLPVQMKAVGDEYVKSEFRRHKGVELKEADVFLKEWKEYADMIDSQSMRAAGSVGFDLVEKQIDDFREEQLGQLLELHKEATKPSHSPKETNT